MIVPIAALQTSDRSVQPDVIALGVLEAGICTEASRNRSGLDQDRAACARNACDGAVQFSIAIQVDHRAAAAGLLEWPFYESSGDAALRGREDAHHVSGVAEVVLLHPASKNRLVETLRPVQIGAGNLEPRCC